jgi:hypothetical protein
VSLLSKERTVIVLHRRHLEREILDFLATSMSRAIIRARGTGTSLALISREALALARLAVADATVRTLRILVVVTELIGSIHPSELKGADALRAIATQVTHANSPVVEATAHSVLPAGAVTRAGIITRGAKNPSHHSGQYSQQHHRHLRHVLM